MTRSARLISAVLASVVAGAAAAPGAGAQESFCADPTVSCSRLVDPTCLSRRGAGVIASAEGDCAAQMTTYRDCLSMVMAQCGAGSAAAQPSGGADPSEALAMWNAIKDSADPDVLEQFAESYPNGPLATLARNQAATLRAAAETAPDEQEAAGHSGETAPDAEAQAAAAAFAPLAQGWSTPALVSFLERFPDSAEAPAARARLDALRGLQREAQRHLNRLGYSVGGADGVWGRRSERGMRRFERDRGLSQSGALSAERIAALREAPTPERAEPQAAAPREEASQRPAAGRLTARLSVTVIRLRSTRQRCQINVPTPSRALSISGVGLDCGGSLRLSLSTNENGSIRSGLAIYDGHVRVPLNGSGWGFSGFNQARNQGEVKQIVVQVSFP